MDSGSGAGMTKKGKKLDSGSGAGMTGRWRAFSYDELIARDKTNLDIFWLKDESLEDTENLPAPEVLAQEIVEQLEAALQEFRSVEEVLAGNGVAEPA
jgi:type I restriction enzyme M protein